MTDHRGNSQKIPRREFLKVTGAVVIVVGAGACGRVRTDETPVPSATPSPTNTPSPTHTPVAAQVLVPEKAIPPADGYILVDIEKCQGCASCMLACSLIHEGVESLSLSRIQVMQNPFESFPYDVTIAQCRQCVDPACVAVCPTDALEADAAFGNVRIVDKAKCIGCGRCFEACPFTPARAFLAVDNQYGGEAKSRKCDLCAYAPYHWDDAGGGPDGKQACVAICPVGAITFTREIPVQEGDDGYIVNLRDETWAMLGYPAS